MKIISITVALTALAISASAVPFAQPDSACRTLLMGIQSASANKSLARCDSTTETLIVKDADEAAFGKARAGLFPNDTYLGFRIVRESQTAAETKTVKATEKLPAALAETMRDAIGNANFDGSVARGALQFVAGPPGSGTGTQSGPPGSGVKHGPPGSGTGNQPAPPPPSGDDDSPSAPPPPSRPTPVFIPRAPSPNWWNTVDWGTVSSWNGLPQDWDQDYFDSSTNRYVSHWYEYANDFTASSGYETASATGQRTLSNQADTQGAPLTSQEIINVKRCYYQAVYDLDWNNTYGEWRGAFQYYRAACIERQRYGGSSGGRLEASFDMQGQSLWPWERETLHLTRKGNTVDAYVENPAFNYTKHWNGSSFEFTAGQKIRTAPDGNGVAVDLVNVGGVLKLHVVDRWGAQYATQPGEQIDLSVHVFLRVPGWFNSDKTVYETNANSPLRLNADAKGDYWLDVPGQGTSGEYYIDRWSFRRINPGAPNGYSNISRPDWMTKGSGPRVRK